MALSWADLGTTYTSGTTPSLTFDFTPTAGDGIVIAIATRETTQTMTTAPSAYTAGPEYSGGSNFNAFTYHKISDGTETSVSFTLGANSNLRISAVVLQGAAGTLSLDDSDSDTSNVTTATTSGGFGSVTTTENDAGVCAILFMDQSWGAVTEPAVTSYTNTNNDPVSSNHGGIDMFTRVLSSTATETPTWSASGDLDQNFGVLLAFKDTLAGGSIESGAGSSAGTSTAAAVGASTAAAAGASAGSATADAVGASTAAGAGASAGAATASGVGASTAEAVGTSAGTSTAAGVSPGGSVESGAGTAAGSATAAAVGASTAAAVGTAAGTSTASAVGTDAAAVTGTPVAAVITLTQRTATPRLTARSAVVTLTQRTATITLEAA